MFTLLKRLFTRQPQQPPPTPHPPPPLDPLLQPNITDGVINRRTRSINGMPADQLSRESRQLSLDDGLIVEEDHRGVVVLADGTATTTIDRGLTRCDLCIAEHAPLVQSGLCSPGQAITASLARNMHIKRSDISGLALCPKHRRTLTIDDQIVIVSTDEASQIELDQQLQRPIQLITNLFIERDHHA